MRLSYTISTTPEYFDLTSEEKTDLVLSLQKQRKELLIKNKQTRAKTSRSKKIKKVEDE